MPDEQTGAIASAAAAHNATPAGGGTQTSGDATAGVPYKLLKATHPEYDGRYWRRLRALAEGGKQLLGDPQVMGDIFPRHRDEKPAVYEERQNRAFYVPYAGEMIGIMAAGLGADPVVMKLQGKDTPGGWPAFYDGFFKDTSPAGGEKVTLHELLKEQITTALQLRTAWTLVEMPKKPDEAVRASLAEQEEAGDLRVWAVPVAPECVVDWEEDEKSGQLLWALVHTSVRRRMGLGQARNKERHRWTFYTDDAWAVFEIEHDVNKPPGDEQMIPQVEAGTHTFGRVPLLRMTLKPGLWAMNKIEGLARAHFNKRCALDWGELQSLLPELYEFQGPESGGRGVPISEVQEDADRAKNQPRGQGYVQIRGSEDKAAFVGPPSEPFTHVLASARDLRDEMHRVLHQMALSVDNSGAALQRSAESKTVDKGVTEVLLGELGRVLKRHAEDILNLVSRGRKNADPGKDIEGQWEATGATKFDAVAVADLLDQALSLTQIPVPSQTFKKRIAMKVVKAALPDAPQEDIDAIEKELELNVTAEDSMAPLGDDDDDEPPAPAAKKKPAAGAKP